MCRTALPDDVLMDPSSRIDVFKVLDLLPTHEEPADSEENVAFLVHPELARFRVKVGPAREEDVLLLRISCGVRRQLTGRGVGATDPRS